jgi:ParB family transcriptional regulator, chromosome partitioning protein
MLDRTLAIEYRNTESLIPYATNSRTHSVEQVAQIVGSIKEFGFTNPVLIDDSGGIVAGHGRVLAAVNLALQQVPCIVLAGLTEVQRRAYVLADNKIPLNAGWDAELLAVELDDLRDLGFEMGTLGFTREELNELIGTPNTGSAAPEGFREFGDDINTEHRCPKCGYEWSGKQA